MSGGRDKIHEVIPTLPNSYDAASVRRSVVFDVQNQCNGPIKSAVNFFRSHAPNTAGDDIMSPRARDKTCRVAFAATPDQNWRRQFSCTPY